MFHHVKELQFNARVSGPDPRFARLLLEQFGGGNGELKAAMQYFVQAFAARQPYPRQYDMLMDIAAEEFSHLEIVGATITMLLGGVNGELKNATDHRSLKNLMLSKTEREQLMGQAAEHPHFVVLTGGGPAVTDSMGVPWSGAFVNANGELTVDLRSNIGAESRAKIVYEYLLQFTDDPYVQDSLKFLMTREVAHFQMFNAALAELTPNFPPGVLQGDPRFTHTYFNMSNGSDARGPWNEGRGPWPAGEEWVYIANPEEHIKGTRGLVDERIQGTRKSMSEAEQLNEDMAAMKSAEVKSAAPKSGPNQWSGKTVGASKSGSQSKSSSRTKSSSTPKGSLAKPRSSSKPAGRT